MRTNEILASDTNKSLCVKNASLSLCNEKNLNFSWFLDEFGRLINENSGYCMVLDDSEEKVNNLTIRRLGLGRCEGFVIFNFVGLK